MPNVPTPISGIIRFGGPHGLDRLVDVIHFLIPRQPARCPASRFPPDRFRWRGILSSRRSAISIATSIVDADLATLQGDLLAEYDELLAGTKRRG